MKNNTIWWIVLIIVIVLGVYFLVVNREPTSDGAKPEFKEVGEPQSSTSTAPDLKGE